MTKVKLRMRLERRPSAAYWAAGAAVVIILAVVVFLGIVVEARSVRLAAHVADAANAPESLREVLDASVLRAGVNRSGVLLGLAGILPVAFLLFGGPRRRVLVIALWLWAACNAAMIAALWTWTRLPG